jgi:hypothetical protein
MGSDSRNLVQKVVDHLCVRPVESRRIHVTCIIFLGGVCMGRSEKIGREAGK